MHKTMGNSARDDKITVLLNMQVIKIFNLDLCINATDFCVFDTPDGLRKLSHLIPNDEA